MNLRIHSYNLHFNTTIVANSTHKINSNRFWRKPTFRRRCQTSASRAAGGASPTRRTSCKTCRLKKCLALGMSKSGSRYGRRCNWFKVHCQLRERQFLPSDDDDRYDKGDVGLPTPPTHSAIVYPAFRLRVSSGRAPLPRSERSEFHDSAVVGSLD